MLNINDQKLIVVFFVCSFVFVLFVFILFFFFSPFKELIDIILFKFQVDPCMIVSFCIQITQKSSQRNITFSAPFLVVTGYKMRHCFSSRVRQNLKQFSFPPLIRSVHYPSVHQLVWRHTLSLKRLTEGSWKARFLSVHICQRAKHPSQISKRTVIEGEPFN